MRGRDIGSHPLNRVIRRRSDKGYGVDGLEERVLDQGCDFRSSTVRRRQGSQRMNEIM